MKSCGIFAEPERSTDRACRVCGCTDDYACDGGCSWVEYDLCSTCEGRPDELFRALLSLESAAGLVDKYNRELDAGKSMSERPDRRADARRRRARTRLGRRRLLLQRAERDRASAEARAVAAIAERDAAIVAIRRKEWE